MIFQKDLKDTDGLVLSNGVVLASGYLTLTVIFDSNSPKGWEVLPIGTMIKFNAKCTNKKALLYSIFNWKIIKHSLSRQFKVILTCDGPVVSISLDVYDNSINICCILHFPRHILFSCLSINATYFLSVKAIEKLRNDNVGTVFWKKFVSRL